MGGSIEPFCVILAEEGRLSREDKGCASPLAGRDPRMPENNRIIALAKSDNAPASVRIRIAGGHVKVDQISGYCIVSLIVGRRIPCSQAQPFTISDRSTYLQSSKGPDLL